jgi:uncharacterized protein (DUF1800 family)
MVNLALNESMASKASQELTVKGLGRFGLGAHPDSLARIGGGIREFLAEEISAKPQAGEHLPTSAEALRNLRLEREQIRTLRLAKAETPPIAATGAIAPEPKPGADQAKPNQPSEPIRRAVREVFQAETLARIEAAKQAPVGFRERLVLFWSNHFCISARKGGGVRIVAGAYEREVIRPHVFGRFEDMLLAAEKHPAMLLYLDNQQSIGPNSRGGQRQQRGLNENLAREILELHTLGVDGGYNQEDVTALARILTGWRFAREPSAGENEGRFAFNANLHEPGDHKLLGAVYREEDDRQGEDALRSLARHPSTARHIAAKLAVHFVADNPDPELISRLERTFLNSGGDLAAVSRALIAAPEAWAGEPSKLRTPYEYLAASVRASGVAMKAPEINSALTSMGQPLWSPPGPNGFPSDSAAWISPEGLKARLDFAERFAQAWPGDVKPVEVAEAILGASASGHTLTAIARAGSRAQGFALLMMAPEFQRR